jgi:hypothetical protein
MIEVSLTAFVLSSVPQLRLDSISDKHPPTAQLRLYWLVGGHLLSWSQDITSHWPVRSHLNLNRSYNTASSLGGIPKIAARYLVSYGILGDFYIICNAPNRPIGAHSQASFDCRRDTISLELRGFLNFPSTCFWAA